MLAKTNSVFGKPVELNDVWVDNHRDHSLCWMNHTIFKKKTRAKFRECICYTCGVVAHKLVEETINIPVPIAAMKKQKRSKKIFQNILY